MFPILGQRLCRNHTDPCQDGHYQRQFKRTAEYQEKFDVEVDVGADAQYRCDIMIHAEADEEIDDQGENDKIAKCQPAGKQRPCQYEQRHAPALFLGEQRRLNTLPTLIEDDRQARQDRRKKGHFDRGE